MTCIDHSKEILSKMKDRVEGICVADPNADCEDCSLKDRLLCKFDKSFANKFLIGNITYRAIATIIALVIGLMTDHWWIAPLYVALVLITFLIFEPRLLCSHCPFYAKPGRTLDCWALRGMPKLWRYHPEPISRSERRAMLFLGGIIDLAPLAFAFYGFIILAFNWMVGTPNMVYTVVLTVLTLTILVVAAYFDKMLRGGTCKICTNFSCAMNKVPDELRKKFLEKNPTMKNAWERAND